MPPTKLYSIYTKTRDYAKPLKSKNKLPSTHHLAFDEGTET